MKNPKYAVEYEISKKGDSDFKSDWKTFFTKESAVAFARAIYEDSPGRAVLIRSLPSKSILMDSTPEDHAKWGLCCRCH